MVDTSHNLPPLDVPLFDPQTGTATEEGRAFFQSLWLRTGSAPGVDSVVVQTTAGNAALVAAAALSAANASAKKAQNLADLTNPVAARGNLGLTALAIANPVAGWSDPTGAGLRTSFDMDWTQVVSPGYIQSEMVALRDQIIALQKRLGQSILDDKTVGVKAA